VVTFNTCGADSNIFGGTIYVCSFEGVVIGVLAQSNELWAMARILRFGQINERIPSHVRYLLVFATAAATERMRNIRSKFCSAKFSAIFVDGNLSCWSFAQKLTT